MSKNLLVLLILFHSIFSLTEDYNQNSLSLDIDDFNVDYEESKCIKTIDTLVNVINQFYVYNDISQNPWNKEYFGVVNLVKELRQIETKNRKYYEFYRDIRGVIGKLKDLHFLIMPKYSKDGIQMDQLYMCIPFSFYVKGNSKDDAKVYIKEYPQCAMFYTEEQISFIRAHLNTPLTSINGNDPFQYIQDFGSKFVNFKNTQGKFSISLKYSNAFPIYLIPLNKEESTNIEFKFDNDSIVLSYTLINLKQKLESSNEFKEFYNKELEQIKLNNNIISQSPPYTIFDIYKKYERIENDKKKVNKINWKYSTKNPALFQCLIDDENQVNVFKQESFSLEDDVKQVINQCTEEFYKNPYPIIGIESNNVGGNKIVSSLVQQLTQVKIVERGVDSLKYSDYLKIISSSLSFFVDSETCEIAKDIKDITDEYEGGIKHHRTQTFLWMDKSELKSRKELRKKYYEYNNLKKPTDIILFTDYFSHSATSYLIKGYQETGGAIIVGYKGNPKYDEKVDASNSPSCTLLIYGNDTIDNLTECGFDIYTLTMCESFNYTYQGQNPIPREYLISPVDERVNIYQEYDDDLYDVFISEAKRIFKKYNEDKECNPDNDLLLYEPNDYSCYTFDNIPHAHGGYQCDKETGKWSTICKPYYCDIGYYFDTYKNQCIKDICTEEDEGEKTDSDKTDGGNFGKFLAITLFVKIFGILILFG